MDTRAMLGFRLAHTRGARCTKTTARQAHGESIQPVVRAPPPDFELRETRQQTRQLVAAEYSDLMPLVDSGELVAVQRPQLYVERRSDGYKEPEVVFVVGTVHLSQKSADAVRLTIERVRPDNVVVELCRTRSGAMYGDDGGAAAAGGRSRDDAAGMRLRSLRVAVQDALDGRGSIQGVALRLIADTLSSRIQMQAGVRAGVEMRAARVASEEIGSQLVLGDRPIEITWERAWDALSLSRKWQVLTQVVRLLTAPPPRLDPGGVDSLGTDDVVDAMTQRLSEEFPEVASPLLHERDLYLAWSLKRSKAVNGCRAVVGVVGRGHMRGVVYHLQRESSGLRFRDLAGTRSKPRRGPEERRRLLPRWATVLAANVALAAGLDALWKAFSQGSWSVP